MDGSAGQWMDTFNHLFVLVPSDYSRLGRRQEDQRDYFVCLLYDPVRSYCRNGAVFCNV